MYVYKKPRGPMKIAVNEQLQDIKEALPNVDQSAVIITHSLVSDELLEYTKTELAKIVDPKSIIVTTSGCVISSHCGKGCIGILYIKN